MPRTKSLLVVLTLLLAAACAPKPILNIENHPIPLTAQPLTLAQIENSIIAAGQQRGWQIASVSAGQLTATKTLPRHAATVEIRYDQKGYTITHKSSINLREKDGMIHALYNRWVTQLQTDIDARLGHGMMTTS